jgi:hypothetical protein
MTHPASWARLLIARDAVQGPIALKLIIDHYEQHDGKADDFGRLNIVIDAQDALDPGQSAQSGMTEIAREVAVLTGNLCPNDHDRDGYCGCQYCRAASVAVVAGRLRHGLRTLQAASLVLCSTDSYDPGGPPSSQVD